jgi:hypothetical protein
MLELAASGARGEFSSVPALTRLVLIAAAGA